MKLVVDNKEFAECMKKILPAVEVSREKKEAAATDMSTCDVPCRMTAPNIFMDQVDASRPNSCFI